MLIGVGILMVMLEELLNNWDFKTTNWIKSYITFNYTIFTYINSFKKNKYLIERMLYRCYLLQKFNNTFFINYIC